MAARDVVAAGLQKVMDLQQNFVGAGGPLETFKSLANGGLDVGDDAWHDASLDGADCRDVALRCLKPGGLLEYHCYDNRGRPQGVAVVRFEGWITEARLEFRGTHMCASDEYYDWYGKNSLVAASTVYHFCENARRSCRSRGAGGGEFLHLSKWRLVSPRLLVGMGYASKVGVEELDRVLNAHLSSAALAPPVGPVAGAAPNPVGGAGGTGPGVANPARRTSGLDDALRVGDDGVEDQVNEDVDRLLRQAKAAKLGRGAPPAKEEKPGGKKGFGNVLLERAQGREVAERNRRRDPSGKKGETLTGEALRKRKAKDMDDEDSPEEGSSESMPGFQDASSREVDRVALSRRNPGCLLRSALKEMQKYLAARGEADFEDPSQGRVLGRRTREVRRPADPKVQGGGGLPGSRRELGPEPPSGIDPSSGIAHHHRRDERSGEGRTPSSKTEGPTAKRGSEIGRRRRGSEESRDATYSYYTDSQSDLRSGSKSDRGAESAEESQSKALSRSSSRRRIHRPKGSGIEEDDVSSQEGSGWSSSERPEPSEGDPLSEEETEEEGWQKVRSFAYNVWNIDASNKSLSQLSVQLVKLAHHCPGVLGDYSKRVMEDAASTPGMGFAWKDVLPLPVPNEVAETVSQILSQGEYKIKKSGASGGAVRNAHRKVGIDCLTYCMIIGLNCMWGGLRRGTRLAGGEVKPAQVMAVERLSSAAMYVIDSKDGAASGGVPRTPVEDWGNKIADARISYKGEVVAKAEPLELARILPSLPPEGCGASVKLADLCEGDLKTKIMDPSLCVLPVDELPDHLPAPKVRVAEGEWEALARALVERGILVPTEQVASLREQFVLNGLFAVEKSNKLLEDGRCHQRLIMDLRATNAIMKTIAGDVATLSGASSFTTLVLESNHVISISGDDLVSSFYLFELPETWRPYMAFERSISWRALGYDRDGSTHLASAVLPMGFNSSVGIMQHVHRKMALWDPLSGAGLPPALEIRKGREWPVLEEEAPAWSLYLDDSTFLRKVEAKVQATISGLPSQEQEALRRAYQFWGVPYNSAKALEECESAERLGAYLDGQSGRIGVTVKRLLEGLSLGFWVLSQGQVSRKALQVFTGKEVHCLQFRRPLFSVYDEVWRLIAQESEAPYLTVKACTEIVVSMCLADFRFTDWRAEVDSFVMATDASETGGGFVMAKRLTKVGREQAERSRERDETGRTGIIVFDFFAGIGGLLRSLERAGVKWEHHVVIESDRQARRCIRRTWAGASEYTDVKRLTKADLAKEIDRVEAPRLIIGAGGSPCQGLSLLSTGRQHFKDERSQLFFDFADRLTDLEELASERNIQFLGMVENVVMDEKDRDEITERLNWKPHLIQSGDISRVRRPRFYWLSHEAPSLPWLEVQRYAVMNQVTLRGEVEPNELWIPDGMSWDGPPDLKFPTFTRPIVRVRPPLDPAGLKGSSQEAKNRWVEDSFRFPPYTYEQKYLLTSDRGFLHKLPASSRELLMGFKEGHTVKLGRELYKKATLQKSEDERQAAIGNSFHTTTVAALLGAVLFDLGYLHQAKSPSQLLADLIAEHELDGTESEPSVHSDSTGRLTIRSPLEAREFDEEAMQLETHQPDGDELQVHQQLMAQLVSYFLRRVEHRGSDIRLDADVIFKPGNCARSSIDPNKWEWKHCRAFKWRHVSHINLLELKALVHAIQWRARRTRFHSFRTMLLCDSQAVIAVVAKGRQERQQLGRLQDLVVKPGTLQKYHSHFNKFHDWASANELPLVSEFDIDAAASEYLEALWADGYGRAEGSYMLAAIQYMVPTLRHNLPLAWRLMKTWSKHELPTRAVPLDAAATLAFAGLFCVWDEPRLAAGILIAFDFFLRTGELFTLRRSQVEFFAGGASLQLLQTKSSTHQLHSERLLAWDRVAVVALRFLCQGLQPNDRLIPASAQRFRTLWHRAISFLKLDDFYIQPYSLRRGGATSAFRQGAQFDQLLVRGRWTAQRTARIYLDEALQQSSLLRFTPTSQHRLRWARSHLAFTGKAI
eukprot:Skav236386  [mRNA]  locus=scaffold29:74303:80602:- [translate_table: standard]